MREEFDKLLCKTFPNLYKDRYASMMQTAMCWGFPGNGWMLLIWNLSEKLEKMILDLPENVRHHCCASQVKEKNGTLRFYMTTATDEMRSLIGKAQALSADICEQCGAPGKLRGLHWYYVACNGHTEECDLDENLPPLEDDDE